VASTGGQAFACKPAGTDGSRIGIASNTPATEIPPRRTS
jgi:hypothetical protein